MRRKLPRTGHHALSHQLLDSNLRTRMPQDRPDGTLLSPLVIPLKHRCGVMWEARGYET